MKRALLAAALLAFPAAAQAETASVSMPGKTFSPSRLTVVAGDSVSFRNADLVAHDVKAAEFNSGPIARFGGFTQRFDTLGPHPFVCSIHPFMAGEVDVVALTLGATGDVLSGRAPAGTGAVAIERDGVLAGSVVAAADGSFSTRASGAGIYRATTAAGASAAVTVSGRVGVKLSISGHRLRVVSAPGFVATFQAYSRERFSWRGFATVKLDARGRGSTRHRGALKGNVRVVVRAGAVTVAISESLRLRDGKVGMPDEGHAHSHG